MFSLVFRGLSFGAGMALAPVPLSAANAAYWFTYFVGHGENGLHLAGSEDGSRWSALQGGRGVLAPQIGKDRLMRDPCGIRGPDGTDHLVLVYFDVYLEKHYGAVRSRDLRTWEDVSDRIALPAGARHGTRIVVPRTISLRLQAGNGS